MEDEKQKSNKKQKKTIYSVYNFKDEIYYQPIKIAMN